MAFSSCIIVAAFLLLPYFCIDFGSSMESITSSNFIKDPEAIFSSDNTFKLGFFSPTNSTNRYVGIWYNKISVATPIWVANRNKPLNDSSGIMRVSEDGNLVVLNGQAEVVWSSNVSNGIQSSSAQLTDDGNLVLQDNMNTIWESFHQPSNILAKNMRLTADERTGEKLLLRSWKSPSDPSTGSFSVGIDPSDIPEAVIWNGSRPYWRSGPWDGRTFLGIPRMVSNYLNGFTLSGDRFVSLSFSYSDDTPLYNFVLSPNGELSRQIWVNETESWNVEWKTPETECDVYGICGVFGACNAQNSPICSCLRGFDPKSADEWSKGNWNGGCVRRRALQCERLENGVEVGKKDGFLKLEKMKVPDSAHWSSIPEQDCKQDCLNNCSCFAYSYYSGFGCVSWTGNLIDLQKFSTGGTDIYIRMEYSELDDKKNMKVIISITVLAGAVILLICAILIWRWKAKHRVILTQKKRKLLLQRKNNTPTISDVNKLKDNGNQVKLQELPVFSLQKLATATDNFDIINKLGQGGFGPVYKGNLPDGQIIAVKRLSQASGQGVAEFMNEVVVISKLQHRNLVRLLGCSVEGEEKMLIYEYMPNKSLDAFIFDLHKKELLDWRIRFRIVEGICRGLLYLHRDSRLRIIHRDLKASNILLDQELNPKISDFGMARIFGGNEDQANTNRVVGTYGYMAPEYAMEGRFSEKSDIFSFGVLLLEIVSGRRNTSFYDNEKALTLLAFAWNLWNEGDTAALVDPLLFDPSCEVEFVRCIHVGLLCVQEFAKDRPAASTVISMLNSEIVDLPIPKQPAFAERQITLYSGVPQQSHKNYSLNIVTVTDVDGR